MAKILFADASKICALGEFGKFSMQVRENRAVSSDRAIIYYDADCGFCRRMLRIVLRMDSRSKRRLIPRAIQDPLAASALAPRTPQEQLASWHLQLPNGAVISAGAAIPALLRLWGWPRAAVALFERFPSVTEFGYRWVADHRVLLGRLTRWIPDLPQAVQPRKSPPS